MALTLDELFASPDHYLHSFDGDTALFVPMDRAAYHRSIFLDGRISPAAEGTMSMPVAALMRAMPRPVAPTGWIFHVAHCGSTLLARALDHLSANLVLREPLALRQTALSRLPGRLDLVAAMLSKRYRGDAPTLVKANVPVNFLLPDLVALNPAAHAIFLYMPLREYLLAILRSDNHRDWLRRVSTLLAPWLGDLAQASDAERVAALWLGQVSAFATALQQMDNARSLNAEIFFAEPERTLSAAVALLQVPVSQNGVNDTVSGPLFSTYSKNPSVRFDNAERLARRAALEAGLAEEVVQAHRWIEKRAADAESALVVLAKRALID